MRCCESVCHLNAFQDAVLDRFEFHSMDAPQGELEDGSEVAIKVRALPLRAIAEEYF